MTLRAVRRVVAAICVAGVAGMIVGSIEDDNTVVLTFGLLAAGAVGCLAAAHAVAGGRFSPSATEVDDDPSGALRIEELVAELVEQGADETTVRRLVREAVDLGRSRRRP